MEKKSLKDSVTARFKFTHLKHLRSHEIIVADQRRDVIGKNQHYLAEQYGDIHTPGNAI